MRTGGAIGTPSMDLQEKVHIFEVAFGRILRAAGILHHDAMSTIKHALAPYGKIRTLEPLRAEKMAGFARRVNIAGWNS